MYNLEVRRENTSKTLNFNRILKFAIPFFTKPGFQTPKPGFQTTKPANVVRNFDSNAPDFVTTNIANQLFECMLHQDAHSKDN